MNAIVPRKTVEMIVAARDQTLALYETAFEKIEQADAALTQAHLMWKEAAPSMDGRYYEAGDETREFHRVVTMPDRDQYLATARRLVDITVWQHVVEISGIEDLMDHTEKEKLRDQMRYRPPRFKTAQKFLEDLQWCVDYTRESANRKDRRSHDPFYGLRCFGNHVKDLKDDPETVEALGHDGIAKAREIADALIEAATAVGAKGHFLEEATTSIEQLVEILENPAGLPPVTVDNIMATMQGLLGQSDEIFQRGVAKSFSSLDRRFRSHDGFKIGSRIIINRLCSDYGSICYGRQEDIFIDVERIFKVLDGGKPGAMYGSILASIRNERSYGAHQSEHEGAFFKVRIFKNGNAHLWFTRKDLVKKVNKCLAEYYGETVGDGMTKEEDPLNSPKTTPAKRHGFFPTPIAVATTVFEKACLFAQDAPLEVLEPSAGTGNLSSPIARGEHNVTCVEIQPHLANDLEATGRYKNVICHNFLQLNPNPVFDRVVMNPPFDMERDIDHVVHALKFLKPNGFLIAIMSAGTEFRETKKAKAFRALVDAKKGAFRDLPDGSFTEVGTKVNTCFVRIWNDGKKVERWY